VVKAGWPLRAVLALWAAAGAACAAIGGGEGLTDAQQVITLMPVGPSDLKIIGAVDHADRRYRVGEPIGITIEVNQPASVAVLRVGPNGATTLIFPNRRHPKARLPANAPLRLSEPGAPPDTVADAPGVVLFEFVASTRSDSWLFSRKPQGSADFAELGTTTRALAKDILLSLGAGHGAAAASHLALRVRAE
jgi:uncharacterized protein DUF4384